MAASFCGAGMNFMGGYSTVIGSIGGICTDWRLDTLRAVVQLKNKGVFIVFAVVATIGYHQLTVGNQILSLTGESRTGNGGSDEHTEDHLPQ
jgi:hypothetical protein